MSLRILIADDHGLLRAGLRSLLSAEPDLQVVGEAADGHEALRLAGSLRPDLVLMDISMPGPVGGGIEATRQLVKLLPQVQVLILTFHEDTGLLREAIRGYLATRIPEHANSPILPCAGDIDGDGDQDLIICEKYT